MPCISFSIVFTVLNKKQRLTRSMDIHLTQRPLCPTINTYCYRGKMSGFGVPLFLVLWPKVVMSQAETRCKDTENQKWLRRSLVLDVVVDWIR